MILPSFNAKFILKDICIHTLKLSSFFLLSLIYKNQFIAVYVMKNSIACLSTLFRMFFFVFKTKLFERFWSQQNVKNCGIHFFIILQISNLIYTAFNLVNTKLFNWKMTQGWYMNYPCLHYKSLICSQKRTNFQRRNFDTLAIRLLMIYWSEK